jgi:hypothetical protein
MAFSFRPELDV